MIDPKDEEVMKEQADFDQDWETKCQNCGAVPTVVMVPIVNGKRSTKARKLKLCGPCCFGDSDTAGGNW